MCAAQNISVAEDTSHDNAIDSTRVSRMRKYASSGMIISDTMYVGCTELTNWNSLQAVVYSSNDDDFEHFPTTTSVNTRKARDITISG
jgi:hypothetical protein